MKTLNPWLFEAPFSLEATHYGSPYATVESEREWLFEAPPTLPTIPTLICTESTPLILTLYVKIDLGCTKSALKASPVCPRPMTGIFIPQNYSATDKVNLILYLQGHHSDNVIKGKAPDRRYYPSNLTIDKYWNAAFYPYFAFREGVNASNKNVILVAPTLGPGSETGQLVQPGGFAAYLDQIMAALSAYGPHKRLKQPPTVGNIILACHSGGGRPMRQLALSTVYAPYIKECWGFDCTYNTGDDTQWAKWAKSHPSSRLFIYSITNSKTALLATKLQSYAKQQKLSNVFVVKSSTGSHIKVPITYWESRIKDAPFLQNR